MIGKNRHGYSSRNELLNIGEPQKTEAAQVETESPSEERAGTSTKARKFEFI